jgi:hypothetical protein
MPPFPSVFRRSDRGPATVMVIVLWSECPDLPASMSPLGLVPSAVGLGYGLRYAELATGQAHERLVFEAVSRPGKGRLIFTASGSGREDLLLMAHGAMEWAMVAARARPCSLIYSRPGYAD